MKILYIITQSELGGAQKYICDLALNLEQDFEIFVAAGPEGNWEIFNRITKEAESDKIISFIKLNNLVRSINSVKDFLGLIEIFKVIRKIKPDIVHLNSSKAGFVGAAAAKLAGVKNIIFTAHGWVFNEPMFFLKKWFYLLFSWFTVLFCDKIICVSEYDKKVALENNIAPENKLIAIHNGIEDFDYLPKDIVRRELGLAIKNKNIYWDGFLIGIIANLYKTKGLEYLIKATYLIKSQIPNSKFQILIIGEGDERQNLEKLIRKFKLWDIVFLVGNISEAKKYLKAFDLFVLPSAKEGLPYTLLEAMSANLPVIASRVGGVPEIIEDGIDGFLVPSKNEKVLARKINEAMDLVKGDEIDKIRDAARSKVKKDFSFDKMLKKTKEIY